MPDEVLTDQFQNQAAPTQFNQDWGGLTLDQQLEYGQLQIEGLQKQAMQRHYSNLNDDQLDMAILSGLNDLREDNEKKIQKRIEADPFKASRDKNLSPGERVIGSKLHHRKLRTDENYRKQFEGASARISGEGEVRRGVAERMPFARGVWANLNQRERERIITNISSGKASQYDYDTLGFYLAEDEQRAKPMGFSKKTADLLSRMPGFIVEMGAGWKSYQAGKALVQKAGMKLTGKRAATGVAGRMAIGTAGELGGAATSLAHPAGWSLIAESMARENARDFDYRQIKGGGWEVDLAEHADSIGMRTYRGLGDAYIEVLTERLGFKPAKGVMAALGKLFGRLPKGHLQRVGAATAAGALRKTSKRGPGAVRSFMARGGIHGPIEEISEEYQGDFYRWLAGVDDPHLLKITGDFFKNPTDEKARSVFWNEVGPMMASFALLSGGGAAVDTYFQGDKELPEQLPEDTPLQREIFRQEEEAGGRAADYVRSVLSTLKDTKPEEYEQKKAELLRDLGKLKADPLSRSRARSYRWPDGSSTLYDRLPSAQERSDFIESLNIFTDASTPGGQELNRLLGEMDAIKRGDVGEAAPEVAPEVAREAPRPAEVVEPAPMEVAPVVAAAAPEAVQQVAPEEEAREVPDVAARPEDVAPAAEPVVNEQWEREYDRTLRGAGFGENVGPEIARKASTAEEKATRKDLLGAASMARRLQKEGIDTTDMSFEQLRDWRERIRSEGRVTIATAEQAGEPGRRGAFNLDSSDPYEILGLQENAAREEIDAALRQGGRKFHPDLGGSVEDFKKISDAADVLLNDKKRAKYHVERAFSQLVQDIKGEGPIADAAGEAAVKPEPPPKGPAPGDVAVAEPTPVAEPVEAAEPTPVTEVTEEIGAPERIQETEVTPAAPKAAEDVEIRELKSALREFAELSDKKGGLTAKEAEEYEEKHGKLDKLLFRAAERITASDFSKKKDTALSDAVGVLSYNALLENEAAYLAVKSAARGVWYGRNTAVDDILLGNNKDISPETFYDLFSGVRETLYREHGKTITLYRAETGKQKKKPTQNWATTRSFAKQFGENVIAKDVPIDLIAAIHVTKNGRYHEVIVAAKAPAALQAAEPAPAVVEEKAVEAPAAAAEVPSFSPKLPPFSIYKEGDSFYVRDPSMNPRGGGDSMHQSFDEAKQEASAAKRRFDEAEDSKAKIRGKTAEAEAAEKELIDSYQGFRSDSPMGFGRARKVLERKFTKGGKVVTRKQLVEEKVAAGWTVDREEGVMVGPGDLISRKGTTKTELDYAEHLIEKAAEAPAAEVTPAAQQAAEEKADPREVAAGFAEFTSIMDSIIGSLPEAAEEPAKRGDPKPTMKLTKLEKEILDDRLNQADAIYDAIEAEEKGWTLDEVREVAEEFLAGNYDAAFESELGREVLVDAHESSPYVGAAEDVTAASDFGTAEEMAEYGLISPQKYRSIKQADDRLGKKIEDALAAAKAAEEKKVMPAAKQEKKPVGRGDSLKDRYVSGLRITFDAKDQQQAEEVSGRVVEETERTVTLEDGTVVDRASLESWSEDLDGEPNEFPYDGNIMRFSIGLEAIPMAWKQFTDWFNPWLRTSRGRAFRKNFWPGGIFGKDIQHKIQMSTSRVETDVRDVNRAIKDLNKALKRSRWKVKRAEKLTASQREVINQLLRTPPGEMADRAGELNAPSEIVKPLKMLREKVDSLSDEMVEMLRAEGQSSEEFKEEYGDNLIDVIITNKGTYLTRTYRVFEDAKWGEKLMKERPTVMHNGEEVDLIDTFQKEFLKYDLLRRRNIEAKKLYKQAVKELKRPGGMFAKMRAENKALPKEQRASKEQLDLLYGKILSNKRLEIIDRVNKEIQADPAGVSGAIGEMLSPTRAKGARSAHIPMGKADFAMLAARKLGDSQFHRLYRQMLGEHTDALENAMRTVRRMSSTLATYEAQKTLVEINDQLPADQKMFVDAERSQGPEAEKLGQATFFGSFTEPIGNDAQWGPLRGKWTTVEFKEGLEQAFGNNNVIVRDYSNVASYFAYKIYGPGAAYLKKAQTVYNLQSLIRNFFSNGSISFINGHGVSGTRNLANSRDAYRAIGVDLWGADGEIRGEEANDFVKKMIRLTVIGDSPIQEVVDMINSTSDMSPQEFLYGGPLEGDPNAVMKTFEAVKRGGKATDRFLTGLYQAGDEYWKILGWLSNRSLLMEAYPAGSSEWKKLAEKEGVKDREEWLDEEAARRVRDQYPTWSQTPEAVRYIRWWPFTGTFPTWWYEFMRTQYYETPRQMYRDFYSGNKRLRSHAIAKFTRYAIAHVGGGYVMKQALAVVWGAVGYVPLDPDEEEALREIIAPWSKQSTIFAAKKGDDIKYMDLSYVLPHSRPKDLWRYMTTTEDSKGRMLGEVLSQTLGEFVELDMAMGKLDEVVNNQKFSGGRVYNPKDPYKLVEGAKHLGTLAVPGTLRSMRNTVKGIRKTKDEFGNERDWGVELGSMLTGFRVIDVNPEKNLDFKIGEFSENLKDSKAYGEKFGRSQAKGSLAVYKRRLPTMEKLRRADYAKFQKQLKAIRMGGVTNQQIYNAMKAAGVNEKTRRAILAGGYSPYEMSNTRRDEILQTPDGPAKIGAYLIHRGKQFGKASKKKARTTSGRRGRMTYEEALKRLEE